MFGDGGDVVVVSSVAYNLAGDYAETPNYLKSLIVSNIVGTNYPKSMGELLSTAYVKSPGRNFKRLFNWAAVPGNYSAFQGLPTGTIGEYSAPTNAAIVAAASGGLSNYMIGQVYSGPADHYVWAQKKYYELYPSVSPVESSITVWTSSYNAITNEITIDYTDERESVVFTPVDFDYGARYIYVFGGATFAGPVGNIYLPSVYIYKAGSGNADLDVIANDVGSYFEEFFPAIPIRSDNQFISDLSPTAFAQTQKAFRKAFNDNISKITDQIADHANLSEIDHAYIVFGVNADVKDKACLEYLYKFFRNLMDFQGRSGADQSGYASAYATYHAAVVAYQAWVDGGQVGTAPTIPDYPMNGGTYLRITNGGLLFNYDIELDWSFIDEETGSGLGKIGAKTGDYWFSAPVPDVESLMVISNVVLGAKPVRLDEVYFYCQVSPTTWKRLRIIGMEHKNYVFRGYAVTTKLTEAFNSAEKPSFVVPLHRPTFDSMGIIKQTQITTGGAHLVVNCYKVYVMSFWAGFISFLFIVIAIALITIFPPSGGLLGSSAGVGAALGLTGVAAIVAGTIINQIAAMIVLKIITKVSVEVFGEKWGAIIGAVVGFVAITVGTGLANGQSVSQMWGSMGSATNLLQLTNAVGSGISGYIAGAIQDIQTNMQNLETESEAKLKEVQEAYAANIGYGSATFDPMSLTSISGNYLESSSIFLSRTLLTGSEIADMSLGMISNFTDLTLNTDLPG